mgnify:CR=1 FL=1
MFVEVGRQTGTVVGNRQLDPALGGTPQVDRQSARSPPGERVLVVKNRAAFLDRYPGITAIAGEFAGSLDDAGERLALAAILVVRFLVPDVPTVAEASGIAGYESSNWYGLVGPAKLPRPIVDRLNQELVFALTSPEVKQKLFDLGLPVVADKPEDLGRITKEDLARWGDLARKMNVKAE